VITEHNSQQTQVTVVPLMLKKALCTLAYYFDGKLHRFYLDENQQVKLKSVDKALNNKEKTLPLLIVARQFYNEQAKTYPIESKSELRKLLALEINDKQLTKHHIWQQKDGQSFVNVWRFNPLVPSAYITLPESLLIALGNESEQVAEVKMNNSLFVGRHNGLIHSALSNAVINNCQRFSMSAGLINNQPVRDILPENLAEHLALSFNQGAMALLPSFSKTPSSIDYLLTLKKIILPFSLVFASYLILSSAYLTTKNYTLQQALLEQTSEVSKALTQQQNFDRNSERYSALQQFLADKNNSAQLWLIMTELFEHARFTNIRIVDGRYILRGSAEKATELLARISQFKMVNNATFDFPTRKSRGQETFVIGFSITADLTPNLDNDLVDNTEIKQEQTVLTPQKEMNNG